MTEQYRAPTGDDLGRQATLYHVSLGALDRYQGPQRREGARFNAWNRPVDDHSRIIVEYPDDNALQNAWEDVLFESPGHAEAVRTDGESDE